MLCILCDKPIKIGADGALAINADAHAFDSLTEDHPEAKFDDLLRQYGICGQCKAQGQVGAALLKLITRGLQGGN